MPSVETLTGLIRLHVYINNNNYRRSHTFERGGTGGTGEEEVEMM